MGKCRTKRLGIFVCLIQRIKLLKFFNPYLPQKKNHTFSPTSPCLENFMREICKILGVLQSQVPWKTLIRKMSTNRYSRGFFKALSNFFYEAFFEKQI